ncbi:MAG TPA: PSD1 and planctomycete cytochrome C domain-containing protein [Pirellulales bacterium]|nr:PSD1 and planctomycete cytochrome C domain-containing protein [Pirellulales bacterium]
MKSRLFLLGLSCALAVCPSLAAEGKPVDFDRDVRPILSDKCFFCHGPDAKHREADLRLDDRDAAVASGAIVPGRAAESKLVARIAATDPDELMPPPASNKKLSANERATLERWIAEGAEYRPHWAYRPLVRPAVPKVGKGASVQNPIDAFVLADLRERKLEPAPAADRATLIRRLSLDLVGLPPKPEEVEAFVASYPSSLHPSVSRSQTDGGTDGQRDRGKAYEAFVDKLLASPHYGERMAVPWLDVVRFADTVGYHGDQNQNIFPYRDYVIDAFNKNKPFDQFTIEQLAGDLLPGAGIEQRVATGFNRLNMMTREGGAQPKEYLAKYAADRVRTVAGTWLGSTMGCCECHDHKFDPFTSRDFYSLAAFFADVKQWGYYADARYAPVPELKGFRNEHPFPPEIMVASPYLARRQKQFDRRIEKLIATTARRANDDPATRDGLVAWRQAVRAFIDLEPTGWSTPRPEVAATAPAPEKPKGKQAAAAKTPPQQAAAANVAPQAEAAPAVEATIEDDGVIVFSGKPRSDIITLPLNLPWLAALRLELIPREEHDGTIARGEPALVRPVVQLLRGDGKAIKLNFFHAEADLADPRYNNGYTIVGVQSGWQPASKKLDAAQTAVWLIDRPRKLAAGDRLEVTLPANNLGAVRVSVSPLAGIEPLEADLAVKFRAATAGIDSAEPRAERDVQLAELVALASTAYDAEAFDELRELQRGRNECRHGRNETMVTVSVEPMTVRVLPRGNWQDDSGAIVEPAVPAFLPQPQGAAGRRLTRLDLARWLVSPENPLTARVVVNRLWKQFFATALSSVVDDLGAQGEPPTHPELLDWLACEFRDSGWDTKHIVRLIVTSNTYRQSSNMSPGLRELDPAGRLLACQMPRRLEAEFVRDNALAIAGLLNLERGGPSVRPYQPEGYYANLQFPNRDYVPQLDDRQYRRGVYMHWQRTFLHPMLANFDAPSREECTAARIVSNTPQQALTLLNDPEYVEAARVFAARLLRDRLLERDEDKLNAAYHSALAREPSAAERSSLLEFLAAQRAHYTARHDDAEKLLEVGIAPHSAKLDATELAAWTSVARVILNLHETITRY